MHRILRRKLTQYRCRYVHGYKFPIIFLSCCPKTASTWFANLLARVIPGYHYFHPESFRRPDGDGTNITDGVLAEFSGRYAVGRAHTAATPENLAVMDRQFQKYMFSVRDLRDVTVSLYYHLQRYPKSSFVDTGATRILPYRAVSPEVIDLPKAESIDAIIDQLLPDLVHFVRHWLDAIEHRENCLLLHYEDMTRKTVETVQRVLQFYQINVPFGRIERMIGKYGRTKLDPGRWKFRKGNIGDWRTELTETQQRDIANLCGDLMPRVGLAA